MKKLLSNMLALFAIGFAMTLTTGCGIGTVVPPGVTVAILKPDGSTIIKSEGVFRKMGRDKVYMVSQNMQAYEKNINILCSDDINMSVSGKWLGHFEVTDQTMDVLKKRIKATKSQREDIRGFELSLDTFWRAAMEDKFSSIMRDVISPYKTDNIREQREPIQAEVKKRFLKELADLKFPVKSMDVLINNLDYPPEITDMRNQIKTEELNDLKNAAIAQAAVAKARRNAELEAEIGKAALVKAQADAAANKVRTESLTPEILEVKRLEAYVEMAANGNSTFVITGGGDGGWGNEIPTASVFSRDAMDKLGNKLAKVHQ